MFILTNGKVTLRPFKVSYTKEITKIIEKEHFDEKTGERTASIAEKEEKEFVCYFENREQADTYAEKVNGSVTDMTPGKDIVEALPNMLFSSIEEARNFIENGIEPETKVTLESLSEVVADIIGGAIDVD